MARNRRASFISVVLAASVVLDQLTKVIALNTLRGHAPIIALGGAFRLQYAENIGAFLSLGGNLPVAVRFWLLTVMVAVFLAGAMVYLFRYPQMHRFQTLGLALVVGGGFSNLLDRLFRPDGHVVDFINLGVGSLRTGIFNIADIGIMAGTALLFLSYYKGSADSPASPEPGP